MKNMTSFLIILSASHILQAQWVDPGAAGTGNIYYNNGNVGIGTASLVGDGLTVNGAIRSEEIIVQNVDGADFVFNPDYNLMPLSEIEAFVKQNHHLPEIPSAAKMQANGVELGKMNMLLLQKIEELTLHVIRLNEEVKELK